MKVEIEAIILVYFWLSVDPYFPMKHARALEGKAVDLRKYPLLNSDNCL